MAMTMTSPEVSAVLPALCKAKAWRTPLCTLASGLLLSACSSFPAAETAAGDSVVAAEDSAQETVTDTILPPVAIDESPFAAPAEEIIYGHFSADVLQRVILAEMAGQRGQDQQALDAYLQLARDTGDLGIIQRASRIATFMREPEASTEMISLWLEHEPDSAEAYQTLALQMLAMGRYREAIGHLETLLDMGKEVDFRIIPARVGVDRQSSTLIPALIAEFKRLHESHPDNRSLSVSLAQLLEQNDQHEEAYELIHDLAVSMGNPPEVVLLEARLLEELERGDEVMARLRSSLESHPDSRQLRFMLGRELINQQDFEGAITHFSAIIENSPDDHEIRYSLALINMEMNHLNDAARHFERLLRAGFREDDVNYYLGYISSQQGDRDNAIKYYGKIDSGNNFLQAQRDLTALLIEADRYPEASQRLQRLRYTNPEYNLPLLSMEAGALLDADMHDEAGTLLNSAIQAFPDNVQLLYLRSVLSTEENDLALMEKDLRRIIELEPDNPVAYNSLGYVLADRTDRHEEAYELIRRAVELAPDDPAIIDSLGWVQYRLGKLEEARDNLEHAFRLYPDHEVAAHLGEVLWVMGDKRAANRIWKEALEETPDSEHIRDAMQRLVPGKNN